MSVVCWFLHAEVEGCSIANEEAARASPFRGLEHELVPNLLISGEKTYGIGVNDRKVKKLPDTCMRKMGVRFDDSAQSAGGDKNKRETSVRFEPRQAFASELTVHGSRVSSSPPFSSWAMVALRLREAGTALMTIEARARVPR